MIGTVGGSGVKAANVNRPKIGEAPAPAPAMPTPVAAPAPAEPAAVASGHGHAHGHEESHGHGHAHAAAPSTDAPDAAAADTARADRAETLAKSAASADAVSAGGEEAAGGRLASLRSDELLRLEANLDDINPQLFESIIAALLSAGARDAWVTNILMKKGRPAFMLCALCDDTSEIRAKVLDVYLTQSSTLGVRVSRVERLSIGRRFETLTTPYGAVSVKLGVWDGRVVNVHPEYEDCKARAAECGVAIKEVFAAAEAAAAHLHATG